MIIKCNFISIRNELEIDSEEYELTCSYSRGSRNVISICYNEYYVFHLIWSKRGVVASGLEYFEKLRERIKLGKPYGNTLYFG